MSQKALPIDKFRHVISKSVQNFPVLIVTGETGSGKSTRVPQFILENEPEARILVTQPRRVSALSLSEYVGKSYPKGDVGFLIGGHKNPGRRLNYVTTGVLRQMLLHHHMKFTHIVVDEVHERDLDIDLCLLLLRRLYKQGTDLKLILMSATIQAKNFATYFGQTVGDIPIIHIPVRMFEVKEYFLNDIAKMINVPMRTLQSPKPNITEARTNHFCKLIKQLDGMYEREAAFLVFLPGIFQITSIANSLIAQFEDIEIIAVHSIVPMEEQRKMFSSAPGKRKIILSTNIAESSITIPDVHIIIDFCSEKRIEWTNGCETLVERFVSKESAEQRKGRAGRVREGTIYRMVTKQQFLAFDESSCPEMLRVSLDHIVLNILTMGIGRPDLVLKESLSPPNMGQVFDSYRSLLKLEAIEKKGKEISITPIGRVIGALPLDVQGSLLVIYGCIFGCVHEAIVVASVAAVGQSLVHYNPNTLKYFTTRCFFSKGWKSDYISELFIYESFMCEAFLVNRNFKREKKWAKDRNINIRNLYGCIRKIGEIYQHLKRFGIDPPDMSRRTKHSQQTPGGLPKEKIQLLKLLIAGAYHSNMCQFSIKNRNIPRNEVQLLQSKSEKVERFMQSWNIQGVSVVKEENTTVTLSDTGRKVENSIIMYLFGQMTQANLRKVRIFGKSDMKATLPFKKMQMKYEMERNKFVFSNEKVYADGRSSLQPFNFEYQDENGKFKEYKTKVAGSYVCGNIIRLESGTKIATFLTQLPHQTGIRDALLLIFSPGFQYYVLSPTLPPIVTIDNYDQDYSFFAFLNQDMVDVLNYLRSLLVASIGKRIIQDKKGKTEQLLVWFCQTYAQEADNWLKSKKKDAKDWNALYDQIENVYERKKSTSYQLKILEFILDSKESILSFPASLGKTARKEIHEFVRKNPLGLESKSTGKNDNRKLSLYKIGTPTNAGLNSVMNLLGLITSDPISKRVLKGVSIQDESGLDALDIPLEAVFRADLALAKMVVDAVPDLEIRTFVMKKNTKALRVQFKYYRPEWDEYCAFFGLKRDLESKKKNKYNMKISKNTDKKYYSGKDLFRRVGIYMSKNPKGKLIPVAKRIMKHISLVWLDQDTEPTGDQRVSEVLNENIQANVLLEDALDIKDIENLHHFEGDEKLDVDEFGQNLSEDEEDSEGDEFTQFLKSADIY